MVQFKQIGEKYKTKESSVYSTLWCLPTCVMSVYLYDVFLPMWWLHDACLPVWCFYLHDVFLPVGCLFNCVMSAYLYGAFSTVHYDVWSTVQYVVLLLYLYDVCSTEWCLLNWMMSAYLNDFFLPVRCPTTCRMSAQLNKVYSTACFFLPVWYSLYCKMSVYVWCLPSCMTSAQQYDVCTCIMSAFL